MASPKQITIKRAFKPLPLGTVIPKDWLLEQLKIQADGLSGHLDEFWKETGPDSGWLGGKGESWELGPYYLDGLVPLAYLLNDDRLKSKVAKWMNWTLSNIGDNGWLGPKTDNNDQWWPRAVLMKALSQYAEATSDRRVEPALAGFFNLMQKTLAEKPLNVWAKFRWGEFLVSLIWLCERRPCPVIYDIAELMRNQGYDWSDHYNYFTVQSQIMDSYNLATHGVNHAMSIKYPGLWSLFSGNEEDRKGSENALKMLDKYHGQATGIFTCDEHLAGRNPSRGTELCSVVEMMYSMEVLASLFGETSYLDRLESLAFNNLPGTFTADMWAHQYDQQANQVLCTINKRGWSNKDDANIYGLAPNYVCCTANFNQGWPKFVTNMWMSSPDNGIAAMAYGPSEATLTIGSSQVVITEKTDYPFKGKIEFEIKTSSPVTFPLMLRIPAWAEGAGVTFEDEKRVSVKPGSFHTLNRRWKNKDKVVLELPMKLRFENRYNNSLSIYRGPLSFSLRIGSVWKQIRGEKPHCDYEVTPSTPWNYALIVNSSNMAKSFKVDEKSVDMPCFTEMKSPVVIKAKAGRLKDWKVVQGSAAPPPASPVNTVEEPEEVELIPYGSAKLRITEFPWKED